MLGDPIGWIQSVPRGTDFLVPSNARLFGVETGNRVPTDCPN